MLRILIALIVGCVAASSAYAVDGCGPPEESADVRDDGRLGTDVGAALEAVRGEIGWHELTRPDGLQIARDWWETFEKQNDKNQLLVLTVAKELLRRRATI